MKQKQIAGAALAFALALALTGCSKTADSSAAVRNGDSGLNHARYHAYDDGQVAPSGRSHVAQDAKRAVEKAGDNVKRAADDAARGMKKAGEDLTGK
jgi:hypothetical protein